MFVEETYYRFKERTPGGLYGLGNENEGTVIWDVDAKTIEQGSISCVRYDRLPEAAVSTFEVFWGNGDPDQPFLRQRPATLGELVAFAEKLGAFPEFPINQEALEAIIGKISAAAEQLGIIATASQEE